MLATVGLKLPAVAGTLCILCCEAGDSILQEDKVISQNIGHYDDSKPHFYSNYCLNSQL